MATSFSKGTAMAKIMALENGTKFYASDFKLAGGTLQGLERNGIIRRTGKKKYFLVNVYDDVYIKASVLEWEKDTSAIGWKTWLDEEFKTFVEEIKRTYGVLQQYGYC